MAYGCGSCGWLPAIYYPHTDFAVICLYAGVSILSFAAIGLSSSVKGGNLFILAINRLWYRAVVSSEGIASHTSLPHNPPYIKPLGLGLATMIGTGISHHSSHPVCICR